MHDPLRVRVRGPLQPYAPGFAALLASLGYTAVSATFQLQLAAHLSRWLEATGLGAHELTPVAVERFLATRRAIGYTNYRSVKAMRPLLEYLRGLGAVPEALEPEPAGALDRLLSEYRRYLVGERGLAPTTARGYLDAVRPFLATRVSGNELRLADLTAADVSSFVVARCPRQARGSAKLTVTALRSLLGYLHLTRVLPRSLVSAAPTVAAWRLAGLPRGLAPGEVRALLGACDRQRPTGCRNFAILVLLVRLGLRAGEVARLALDDLDWRAGELVVRGKGNVTERLPLPADVGQALVAYLRHARPVSASGRTVFVRAKAPHRALTSSGVSRVVGDVAERAGLGLVHAHRLRHTAATEMLRAGGSLAEIGQVLRHRAALTTAIYAKVDLASLHALARPWPGAGA